MDNEQEVELNTDVATGQEPAEYAAGYKDDGAVAEGAAPRDNAVAGEEPAAEVEAAPAYTPNFKFKAMGQEKEIDEWARPLVKDADSEKKVRELYERAHGLEPVKQKLLRTREQFQEVSSRHNQVSDFVEESIALRDSSDYGALFDKWKIDPVAVAKWLSREIEMTDPNTPASVKETYRQSLEATRNNLRLQRENSSLTARQEESVVATLASELQQVMSQPDVSKVQQEVDSRTGKAGTFYRMVVNHAIAAEAREGRQLSADEATKEVLETMGVFVEPTPAPTAQGRQGNAPRSSQPIPQANATSHRPATLPKAAQTGAVPTKKGVTSIEDLKRLRAERFSKTA